MALQFVRITQEAVYNTFNTSPTTGQQVDLFLPVSDAMTVRPDPKFWDIFDAGVGNRLVRKNVGRIAVGGSITTHLFPSQALLLTNLAASFSATAPCFDIPSFTIDNIQCLDNGACTEVGWRYTGCKIGDFELTADQSDEGCKTTVKMSVMGSTPSVITTTQFPIPAFSAYPSDDPFLFYQLAGNVTINGSARTNFQNFSLSIKNVLKPFVDENVYIQQLGWKGRTVSYGVQLLYKSNADRLAFNAGTKGAVSFEFLNTVTSHSATFNLEGTSIIDGVSDVLPLDDFYTQRITGSSLMDTTAGTDLTITVT